MSTPPPKYEKELQSFLGKVNNLNKFSQMTAGVWKPKEAYISEDRMGMEWHVSGIMQQSHKHRQDAYMKHSMMYQSPYTWKQMHLVLA